MEDWWETGGRLGGGSGEREDWWETWWGGRANWRIGGRLGVGAGMSGGLGQKLSAGSLVELAEELELVVSVNGVPLLSFPEGVGELTGAEMKASDDTVVKAQQRAKTSSPDFVPEVVGVVGSGAESQGGIMTGRLLEDLTV